MLKLKRHKSYLKDFSKVKMSEQHYVKYLLYLAALLKEEPLPPEALDHQLQGAFADCREFHISGDLILIYRVEDQTLQILRIGTHAQLFE